MLTVTLEEIQVELDKAKVSKQKASEDYRIAHAVASEKIRIEIEKELLAPYEGATVNRLHIQTSNWRTNGPAITGDIEFIKDGKSVFGSDFSFEITEREGLFINSGSCGSYSLKDKQQILKALLIADFWKKVDLLEGLTTSVDFNNVQELETASYKAGSEVEKLERDLRKAKIEMITGNLHADVKFQFKHDLGYYGRPFDKFSEADKVYTITHVTKDSFYIDCGYSKYEKVAKQSIASSIECGDIILL